MKYKMQPLRIHTGWEIIFNSFTEYDNEPKISQLKKLQITVAMRLEKWYNRCV